MCQVIMCREVTVATQKVITIIFQCVLDKRSEPFELDACSADNNTANGVINNTMKQKHSKAIDVRFYWLRDRAQQGRR